MEYIKKYWYQIALITYLAICLFDFIGCPLLLFYKSLFTENEMIRAQLTTEWIPFTLRSGGLFHLSFGAILTGTGMVNKKNGGVGK